MKTKTVRKIFCFIFLRQAVSKRPRLTQNSYLVHPPESWDYWHLSPHHPPGSNFLSIKAGNNFSSETCLL
jgi:hypothetical protein